MKKLRRRATLLLCAVTLASFASTAMARPAQKTARLPAASPYDARSADAQPYPTGGVQASAGPATKTRRQGRAAQGHTGDAFGGYTSNALVTEARKYLGTNPTGRSTLWCGAFMDMVLKRTGRAGGGNLAKAYASYGARVSGPQVGAIAVMRRGGGGHVGVVSGIDPNGNPIIVSGNHNRTVAEAVYPRSRITAYVMPGS